MEIRQYDPKTRNEILTVLGFLHAGDRQIPTEYIVNTLMPWVENEIKLARDETMRLNQSGERRETKIPQNVQEQSDIGKGKYEIENQFILETSKDKTNLGINEKCHAHPDAITNLRTRLEDLTNVRSMLHHAWFKYEYPNYDFPYNYDHEFIKNMGLMQSIIEGLKKTEMELSANKEEVSRMTRLFKGSNYDGPVGRFRDILGRLGKSGRTKDIDRTN